MSRLGVSCSALFGLFDSILKCCHFFFVDCSCRGHQDEIDNRSSNKTPSWDRTKVEEQRCMTNNCSQRQDGKREIVTSQVAP